jgi:hypothetical protein
LAGAIIEKPELHLNARQARVIHALLNQPMGMQRQDLARSLGYNRPSSLSMLLQRVYVRLNHLAEDLAA